MATRPHVLFILHLPPPVHGAAMVGQHIHDSALVNATFDCHFINLTTASDLSDISRFRFRKIFSFGRLLRQIRSHVKSLRPDCVYVTPNAKGGPFYKDFIVVMMLKHMGCRVVAHYHNKGVASRQDRPFDDFLYRRFFRGLKVILLSERLYPDIRKYVARENVRICPNGIPWEAAPVRKPSDGPARILFLSNLLADKGVRVLLDALEILQKRGVPFRCDLVGGETQEIRAADLADEMRKRNLEGNVRYLGKRFGEEKATILDESDIFVFPTFYPNECFPLVLLEAMAHGLPCISTEEGAVPDILDDGETGLIAKKKAPADLADKIESLLLDAPLRRRMGEAGRRKYVACFTLERFERDFVNILNAFAAEED